METISQIYIEADKLIWENVAPGMNRKILGYDERIMMVKVHFDKGGIGVRHKHHHSQTTYIVNGSFEVSVGEEKKTLRAGDGFYIPPEIEHGALCLEEGILIDVFSPTREDFLNGNSSYNPEE